MRSHLVHLWETLKQIDALGYSVHSMWDWARPIKESSNSNAVTVIFGPEGCLFISHTNPELVMAEESSALEDYPRTILKHAFKQAEGLFERFIEIVPELANLPWKLRLCWYCDLHELGATPDDARTGFLFPSEIWNLHESVNRMFLSMRNLGRIEKTRTYLDTLFNSCAKNGIIRIGIADLRHIQYDVQLPKNPESTLLRGGPGTGKTYQLISKAETYALLGLRVLFVCYNRPLAAFLHRELKNIQCCVVLPYFEFCEVLCRANNISMDSPKELDYWNDFLPKITKETIQANQIEFDAIIVDEAQDLTHPNWWDTLKKIGSIKYWQIACDAGQGIYHHEGRVSLENLVPTDLNHKELKVNFRNQRKIVHELNRSNFWNMQLQENEFPTPSGHIEIIKCGGQNGAWQKALTSILKEMPMPIGNILEPGIVIIGPRKFENSTLGKMGDFNFGSFTIQCEKTITEHKPNVIPYYTAHRFKGLEAEKVILVDFQDREVLQRVQRLYYLSLSRARKSVWILDA